MSCVAGYTAIKFIPVYYEGHSFLEASVTAFPVTQHHIPEDFKPIYKFILEQATKTQRGENRYSSTLSLTSVLDRLDSERHAPAALPPGKTRYPLYRTLGGPQGRSGRVWKISPPPRFDPQTFQPVASLKPIYTAVK